MVEVKTLGLPLENFDFVIVLDRTLEHKKSTPVTITTLDD